MCITTIQNEVASVPWDIVLEDEEAEVTPAQELQIKQIKDFFYNPNTNKENFESIIKKIVRDICEIDAGVLEKSFNKAGQFVEMTAKDGATFTKNPDIHGMMGDREDFILADYIAYDVELRKDGMQGNLEPNWITAEDARQKAAYFQYGWVTGARPIPFGKREIVWFEQNPRTDSLYGRGAAEVLNDVLQMLIYSIQDNLEYYNDNSIPRGFISLDGAEREDIEAFQEQWNEQTRTQDSVGNWRKKFHHVPVVGKQAEFKSIQFSNAELQLIDQQRWFSKMVWAVFGVTPTELGYTEDAKGMSNQIVQSRVFRKKAINPLLRLLQYKFNSEIIPEFEFEGIMFKFMIFDTDEETRKYELYKLQTETGIRTINEIRRMEGLDEVEWGDQPMSITNSFNQDQQGDEEQGNGNEKPQGDEGMNNKEKKPKVSKENEKNKEKSLKSIEDNPLILREGERMDESHLLNGMLYLIDNYEKKVMELLKSEAGSFKLNEVKSVDGIAKGIKEIISFLGIKAVSDMVIKNEFSKGWEKQEKQLNQNFIMNKEALDYLKDYTFNNIKVLGEEMANDLRAELERGIINGEGVGTIATRLKDVMNISRNRAEMISRTETNRAENQGSLQAMKNVSEDYNKQWLAHIDARTSPLCKSLNGQTIGINENFKGKDFEGQAPPAHVNCRSTLLFLQKDKE